MAQSLTSNMAKLKGFKKDNGGVKGYSEFKISELTPDTENNGAYNNSNGVEAEVTALAEDIAVNGLRVPFIVRVEDGKNYIVSGHRRYHAIQTLIKAHRLTGEEKYVAYTTDRKFANDTELKMFMLGDNITQRKKTDGILFYSFKIVKEYWNTVLKKDKEKLKELSEFNKGYKNAREYAVMELAVSSGTVAKLENIEKNGTAELKKALEDDKITLEIAYLLANLPPEIKAQAFTIALENDKDTAREQITALRDSFMSEREQASIEQEIKEYEDEKEEKTSSGEKSEKKQTATNKAVEDEKPDFDEDEESKDTPQDEKPDTEKVKKVERTVTKADFLKIYEITVKKIDETLSEDTRNAINGLKRLLENVLSKDDETIFAMIDNANERK